MPVSKVFRPSTFESPPGVHRAGQTERVKGFSRYGRRNMKIKHWRYLIFPWYVLKMLYLMAKYPQVREAVGHLSDLEHKNE